jgi:hypothetical protein
MANLFLLVGTGVVIWFVAMVALHALGRAIGRGIASLVRSRTS